MRLLSLSEVSIQKRTSPGKLGIRDFEISFAFSLVLAFEVAGQQWCLLFQFGGAIRKQLDEICLTNESKITWPKSRDMPNAHAED